MLTRLLTLALASLASSLCLLAACGPTAPDNNCDASGEAGDPCTYGRGEQCLSGLVCLQAHPDAIDDCQGKCGEPGTECTTGDECVQKHGEHWYCNQGTCESAI